MHCVDQKRDVTSLGWVDSKQTLTKIKKIKIKCILLAKRGMQITSTKPMQDRQKTISVGQVHSKWTLTKIKLK